VGDIAKPNLRKEAKGRGVDPDLQESHLAHHCLMRRSTQGGWRQLTRLYINDLPPNHIDVQARG
jgi:hypothetical protein